MFFFFLDVITIEKTGEFFRLIYDVKGRFTIHRITAEEAKVCFFVIKMFTDKLKLCSVFSTSFAK